MTGPRRKTVVVTGSRIEFQSWCRDNGWNPRDPSLIPISRNEDLQRIRGLCDFDVVYYGSWFRSLDENCVAAEIRTRQVTGQQAERPADRPCQT